MGDRLVEIGSRRREGIKLGERRRRISHSVGVAIPDIGPCPSSTRN